MHGLGMQTVLMNHKCSLMYKDFKTTASQM